MQQMSNRWSDKKKKKESVRIFAEFQLYRYEIIHIIEIQNDVWYSVNKRLKFFSDQCLQVRLMLPLNLTFFFLQCKTRNVFIVGRL